MVLSSFLLTPATALRYEKHDRHHRELSTNEALSLGLNQSGGAADPAGDASGAARNPRRRVITKGPTSQRDEYYVSLQSASPRVEVADFLLQKLMAKDLDDWEQKRVERWKGEPDGRF